MRGELLRVISGSPDRPLKIGNLILPCYVLEDETRVLSEEGIADLLGLNKHHSPLVKGLLVYKNIYPFLLERGIILLLSQPLRFLLPENGRRYCVGYEAGLLGEICNAIMDAKEAGLLKKSQYLISKRCEIIARVLSKVSITTLVDEATGYEEVRSRLALEGILSKYMSKELLSWTLRFPDEFYRELFRLRNWQWRDITNLRPSSLGRLMLDIVYERLSPVVLEELKKKTPKKVGDYKNCSKSATLDVGHPALNNHLYAVTALMRASVSWDVFKRAVQRAFPKQENHYQDFRE